jgi:hypothetical protein
MPYYRGRFVRTIKNSGASIQLPATAEVVEENTDKKILEKIKETKKEEAMNEDQKKERLKKFVSFKIKGTNGAP